LKTLQWSKLTAGPTGPTLPSLPRAPYEEDKEELSSGKLNSVIRRHFDRMKRNKNQYTYSWPRGTNTSSFTRKPTGSLEAEIFLIKSRIII
jgi:hypothetical protein